MCTLDSVAVVCFNLILLACTFLPYVIAKVGVVARDITGSRCCFLLCQRFVFLTSDIGWRLVFFLCFWVQIRADGLDEFRAKLGASGRPAIVVANHQSFLDTIILVTFTPLSWIARSKMFVSSHLLKVPFLRTIVKAMDHLVVPFKGGESFDLDKELMAQRQQQLEDHVKKGGVAGWFPEGRMNPGDCSKVLPFRAGGFMLATHVDVEVWCVALWGNSICWPRTAAVGGRPCEIRAKIFKLCDSSFEFVSAGSNLQDDRAASIYIANEAGTRIQEAVNELTPPGYVFHGPPGTIKPAVQQPLLPPT